VGKVHQRGYARKVSRDDKTGASIIKKIGWVEETARNKKLAKTKNQRAGWCKKKENPSWGTYLNRPEGEGRH